MLKRKGRLKPATTARSFFDRLRPRCENPLIVLHFAASSSLYDDAPLPRDKRSPNCSATGVVATRALEKLFPLVQPELHRLAHHYMSWERAGHTLQTTAIRNEAYLRLVDNTKPVWQGRTHFIAAAAQLMRRVMVHHARREQGQRVVSVARVKQKAATR